MSVSDHNVSHCEWGPPGSWQGGAGRASGAAGEAQARGPGVGQLWPRTLLRPLLGRVGITLVPSRLSCWDVNARQVPAEKRVPRGTSVQTPSDSGSESSRVTVVTCYRGP